MYFYYVQLHYLHLMLILKLLCTFKNSAVYDLYEHYSSTHTHAIVFVILSPSSCPCCGAFVAPSLSPCHCHGDEFITPSLAQGCPCHPVTVTEVCLSPFNYHRVSLPPRHCRPVFYIGVSVIVLLSSWHCHDVFVAPSLSPLLYHGYVCVTLSPSQDVFTTPSQSPLSLSQCHLITVAVLLSLPLSRWLCHYVLVIIPLLCQG